MRSISPGKHSVFCHPRKTRCLVPETWPPWPRFRRRPVLLRKQCRTCDGFSLTHLRARIAELIVTRDRVKFSGLLALAMINAILVVFANWLSLCDLHSITSWNLAYISVQFLFAINVFLICVLGGPKAHDDGPIDLEDFL